MFKKKTMEELKAERERLRLKLEGEEKRRKVLGDISKIKAVRKKHSPVRKFRRIVKEDVQKGIIGGLKQGTQIAKEGKKFMNELIPPAPKGKKKKKQTDIFGYEY